MFNRSSCEYPGPMSFGQGDCHSSGGMDDYYGNLQSQWPSLERVRLCATTTRGVLATQTDTLGALQSPYGAVTHPYNAPTAYQSAAILTPISLPDNSYVPARNSPVLSHHSQEYQYPVSESAVHHGLGITTPFPSELTRDPSLGLGISPSGYGLRDGTISPQPSKKRSRRESKQSISREPPVTILPHPEGLQRLEQERRHSHPDPHPQRPRAPGRGRRDPQAEEEDAFVEQLREQNLAWRVIREMFREKYNKDATEARLQMRQLRRRKERLQRWDEHDVRALLRARHYWEQEKYKLIAQKMTEFGATTFFTAEQCEAQLEYIDAQERARDARESPPQHRTIEPQRKRRRTESKDPGEKEPQSRTAREKRKRTTD
ncbi:uncharacterized protein BJX67DRAFT_74961 [Aspergillus lucknowensis]|uniref:BZIP domain-containing protein n=1 Tax=Aspergillus lucknowensis TaxID=176173 RepID=A0ABR4LXF0_9EURO